MDSSAGQTQLTTLRCDSSRGRFFVLPLVSIAMAGSIGCEYDSWLDPSVAGYWESTPASAPILDRLDVIETNPDEFAVKTSTVKPDDLVPEITPYIVGPGDALQIEIFELLGRDTTFQTDRVVSPTGDISLPTVGIVNCSDLTAEDIKQRIADVLVQKGVLLRPEVSVIVLSQQQSTYGVMGQVQNVARFPIPQPRYLLLDALAAAGGIPDSADKVYVIRQVPLSEEVIRGWSSGKNNRPDESSSNGDGSAEQIERMIRELQNAQPDLTVDQDTQPTVEQEVAEPADELIDVPAPEDLQQPAGKGPGESIMAPAPATTGLQGAQPPISPELTPSDMDGGRWVYLDERWVRIAANTGSEGSPRAEVEEDWLEAASRFVTQRVIEIPVKALIGGDARYNIVIRPNDVIRVPFPQTGTIYLDGQVARSGPIRFPDEGRITLIRAIAAAGGLGPLAIPERVDITRYVGHNRQATVTVNYRAIKEMTEPDVWLKPGDVINVGTTWYAAPLAVIRNGFRTTYGFGFLLDRNFGNDVFGAPPTNRFGE